MVETGMSELLPQDFSGSLHAKAAPAGGPGCTASGLARALAWPAGTCEWHASCAGDTNRTRPWRPIPGMFEYYDRLGVRVGASPREIKAAYRRRARQYHPDVNPTPGAAEQFKRVHEAYQFLSGAARPAPGSAGAGGPGGCRRDGGTVAGPFSPVSWLTLMSFG